MRFQSLSSVIALAVAITLQAQQQPKPKSPKEVEALQKVQAAQQAAQQAAVQAAQMPNQDNQKLVAQKYDDELKAIDNVLENFTDTEYKPMLLNMAMDAAQRKGDQAQMTVYGERVIQADPNNIPARVLLAESLASHTRENDLDKDQSLKKVDDYANKALDLLKTADNPPIGMNPAQWPDYKKELTSQAYDALGQAADLRKNYPDAIKDFQSAIQAQPANAVPVARLSKAYVGAKQYDDAISTADKVLAMNDAPASVKQFAQSQKDAATKLKAAPAAK